MRFSLTNHPYYIKLHCRVYHFSIENERLLLQTHEKLTGACYTVFDARLVTTIENYYIL